MLVEIKIPSPGESISEVEISSWLVNDGDIVKKNQEIAMIESDKATLSLIAEEAGKIKIHISSGKSVTVGVVACTLDTSFSANASISSETKKNDPIPALHLHEPIKQKQVIPFNTIKLTPLAKKIVEENNLKLPVPENSRNRIYRKDIESILIHSKLRGFDRVKMSMLRRKLSQRLVAVKNETAMLTTFNEIDMSAVIALRKKYQTQFVSRYGLKLGFMSFFTKAASFALKLFPSVNASLDNDDVIYYKYSDIAVAVQTDKGLMTPVLRNTELMSVLDIESGIAVLADRARTGKISVDELTGGTFTISNGGIFGSMLSTPILNPPQSGILGMHNIIERPVAINGQVEIRSMMYVALSYDHRIIDGRDSVGFLLKVKEFIESPETMALANNQSLEEFFGVS